ncbi:MAG: acyl-homoserine-lactone synthase [Paracoccaceae bacterium]
MLRYIYGNDLNKFPELADGMFSDRADQFRTRLGWDVQVDQRGHERDSYDDLNPLYLIWENAEGQHGGSMRFLPTTGPVMINDVFGDLISTPIESPLIWECTRFCLARGAGPHVAGALMLGGGEIMRNFGIRHFAGVFDRRMVRIYRSIGSSPEVLGATGQGRDRIHVGLWEFTAESYIQVAARAGIAPAQSKAWFDQSFGRSEVEGIALSG